MTTNNSVNTYPIVSAVSGTTNEINISGTAADPIFSISNNPIIPGVAGLTLPNGTTANRGGGDGTIRFNTTTMLFEGTADGSAWNSFLTSASAITLTGDVTGSGTTSIATTLADPISRGSGMEWQFTGNSSFTSTLLSLMSTSASFVSLWFIQKATTPWTAYIQRYTRTPNNSFSLVRWNNSVETGVLSTSDVDDYVTISNGLHMNSSNIDTVDEIIFNNGNNNTMITLYQNAANQYQFSGFGVQTSKLVYYVGNTTTDHSFIAGTSSSTSQGLVDIKGTGDVVIISGTLYPCKMCFGWMNMVANATTTTITTANTFYKVAGTTTLGSANNFTMPANNLLTYGGIAPIVANITATASVTQNQLLGSLVTIVLFKNGTLISGTNGSANIASGNNQTLTTNTIIGMNPGDDIEVYTTGSVNGQTVTFQNMQVAITS